VLETHPIFKIVWKSNCTPRIKFFFWLLLVDQLNTKTVLTRRHIGAREDDLCVMCNMGVNETIERLFFSCPFANQCWSHIDVYWDLTLDKQNNNLDFFIEITLLAAWELWKLRNDKIFNRGNHSIDR
jgi:hypothetical protein